MWQKVQSTANIELRDTKITELVHFTEGTGRVLI